jgi:hypothetical protein
MSDAGVRQIPFNSPLHKRVISEFKSRLNLARDAQRVKREQAWKESEDTFMAYLPETEEDTIRKGNRNGGLPQYTTITIPYSYAMLLTSHTYYTSVFLARNPILQMSGRHGESQTAESIVESLLDYQLTTGGGTPSLFIWLLDVGKYGYGVVGQYWDKEIITTSQYQEVAETFMGIPIPGKTKRQLITTQGTGYVGNRLYNIRPQDFYNDPRYPVHRFQEGEFCIVFDRVGWNKLVKGKSEGKYSNLEFVGKQAQSDPDRTIGSAEIVLPGDEIGQSSLGDPKDRPAYVDLHEFYWEIVPSDYGLGPSKSLEKWVFTIAGKEVVLSCQPLGLLHGKYPFDVLTHEVEGYAVHPRSMLEILDPVNKTMEWLLNSHFYNVRAALNNMFLGDPSRIVMKDVENPNPGKFIRLKPAAYGQDVRSMMAQFPVQDVTRSNINDLNLMGDMAQRIGGVSDNVMGMINPGGRRTATEVRTSTSFSANRLKTICEWFSSVGFAPLAQKMLQSSQQLYDAPRKYRIVGDLAQWGQPYVEMTPDAIQGFFDFVPVDGTMPVDRYAQANLWNQMFQTMSKMPQVLMQYDVAKMFGFVAQLAGMKNVNQFRVQVRPDAMLAAQAQAGNVVPMRGNPMEPGQIPNMGATG